MRTCLVPDGSYHLHRRRLSEAIDEGMASSIALARLRFMMTVASIHSPQFTQRQAGMSGCSVISSSRESVKLGTIKPLQRPQVELSFVSVLMVGARARGFMPLFQLQWMMK